MKEITTKEYRFAKSGYFSEIVRLCQEKNIVVATGGGNDRRISVRFRQRRMPFLIKTLLFHLIVARLIKGMLTPPVFSVAVVDFLGFKMTFSCVEHLDNCPACSIAGAAPVVDLPIQAHSLFLRRADD